MHSPRVMFPFGMTRTRYSDAMKTESVWWSQLQSGDKVIQPGTGDTLYEVSVQKDFRTGADLVTGDIVLMHPTDSARSISASRGWETKVERVIPD